MISFFRRIFGGEPKPPHQPLPTSPELQSVQVITQQVVTSLEGSVKIPGAAKKALAVHLVGELLERAGVDVSPAVVDSAIEVAVGVHRAINARGSK